MAKADQLKIMGTIFNLQRFSLHDGPGIRTTVFMKGCPLKCWWCHNPESIDPWPQLLSKPDLCIGCHLCLEACRHNALTFTGPVPSIDRELCLLCLACAESCPAGAIEAAGREVDAADLLDELLKDRLFFEESKGGVTFSGGEPLMQPSFVLAVLKMLKAEKIHTALDTCGQADFKVIEMLIPYTDLFLFDLKHASPEAHLRYTGVSGELIKKNLGRLLAMGVSLWVRVPLVPGVNDDDGCLREMAGFLKVKGAKLVELLPYHGLGVAKSEKIGQNYKLAALNAPTKAELARAANYFAGRGITVKCEVDHENGEQR